MLLKRDYQILGSPICLTFYRLNIKPKIKVTLEVVRCIFQKFIQKINFNFSQNWFGSLYWFCLKKNGSVVTYCPQGPFFYRSKSFGNVSLKPTWLVLRVTFISALLLLFNRFLFLDFFDFNFSLQTGSIYYNEIFLILHIFYFLLPISRESIVFGSNFWNRDFDGITRFEVSWIWKSHF